MRTYNRYATLTTTSSGLEWASSYDPGLVVAIKQAVPPEHRRWDPTKKVWLIAPQYGAQVARLTEAYLGIVLAVPQVAQAATTETRLLKVEYLGACKDRGNGESTASGWADGSWSVVIPEQVLREWFEAGPPRPDEAPTLYAVLAVKATATTIEVRSAYRRLARQTHPDVNKEPDAAQQFKAVQHAYEVLGNEAMRRKYDAGRLLEASLKRPSGGGVAPSQQGWRSPLRCGWILAVGQEAVGRFGISQILGWEDVTDVQGKVLVTSWPLGATTFVSAWV